MCAGGGLLTAGERVWRSSREPLVYDVAIVAQRLEGTFLFVTVRLHEREHELVIRRRYVRVTSSGWIVDYSYGHTIDGVTYTFGGEFEGNFPAEGGIVEQVG